MLNFFMGAWGAGVIALLVAGLVAVNLFNKAVPLWAWIVAIALLAAWGMAQRTQLYAERAAHAQKLAEIAGLTAAALQEARAQDAEIDRLSRALQTTFDTREKEDRHEVQAAAARAAAAESRAASLHDQLRTIARAYTGARDKADDAATLAADLAAARSAVGVLADVYERTDRRAGKIAVFADAAHAAGKRCERDYDAARAAVMQGVR